MQLKRKRAPTSAKAALAAASASLLATCGAHADDVNTFVDTGLLFYQESGGRVQAIEPAFNVRYDVGDGESFKLGFVADTLTGATPLGAVASSVAQNFIRPLSIQSNSGTQTVTSASGGSTVVTVPPPPGTPAATVQAASSTVAANTFPLDKGFNDQRYAGNLAWIAPLTDTLKLTLGGAYSGESDYSAATVNALLAQDFNSHDTTVSLGVNYEHDSSSPIGGTPTGLTVMSGAWKNGNKARDQVNFLAGLTQVMTRRWLTSVNYSFGDSTGYETDPYKVISVVDAVTGIPNNILYENRPNSRQSNSVYWDNRFHLPHDVVDVSARYYWDDWGISSWTLQGSYRFQFSSFYVEPQFRWYQQNAANFFHYFLVDGNTLPAFASADTRLADLESKTANLKIGIPLDANSELTIRGGYYLQQGDKHPGAAFGQLQQQNLFPELKAATVMIGYSFAF